MCIRDRCKTGDITSKVSKEYYKLTNSVVEVIGTNANIKVGAKVDGSRFVGTKWTQFPEQDHPDDLAFVQELFGVSGTFLNTTEEIRTLILELAHYQMGKIQNITKNLEEIVQEALLLIMIDDTSQSQKIDHKNYKKAERMQLYKSFNNVIIAITEISFFTYPDQVTVLAGTPQEALEVNNATKQNGILTNAADTGVTELKAYYRGLLIKEADFDDTNSTTHHKMERTKKSIFGDTWESKT